MKNKNYHNNTKKADVKPKSKPLILAMQEAESGIVNSVNSALQAGIPCYLLEKIIDKIHGQIKDGAARELTAAIAQANADEQNAPESEEQAEGVGQNGS